MTNKVAKNQMSYRMSEALRVMSRAGQGDSDKANKLRETRVKLDAAPDSVMNDKSFLKATWKFCKNLLKWAVAVFTGTLRWACNVFQSLLGFIGACFNGLAVCAEEYVDNCTDDEVDDRDDRIEECQEAAVSATM